MGSTAAGADFVTSVYDFDVEIRPHVAGPSVTAALRAAGADRRRRLSLRAGEGLYIPPAAGRSG